MDFILEHYDVYILPVVNPDGYVYTWTDVSILYRVCREIQLKAINIADGKGGWEYQGKWMKINTYGNGIK